EKVGGNKNKGWKPWRCPSAGCASSASSSTKGVKNGNGGRLSTSGLADVELSLLWLDVGEGKEVDLKECPRSKLRKQCIKYLITEKERKVSSFKFSSWRSDFSCRKA
ncbi:hypothetical protein Tco_1048780, partial [Tanacetum coccineum]